MPQGTDVVLRCPDGTGLMTRLWRPEGKGPWPVLLMRQPYGRSIASTVTYAHPSWYASHGFLVAVQDVRGRGDSEGCFGGFAQEAADGAAAVRWARGLADGNGRVGTYGFSYQGLTQLLNAGDDGAGGGPDPLPDCTAPAMCGLDERLHWACEGGAHWWALGVGWALQLAAEGCRRRGDGGGWLEIRRALEDGTHLRDGLRLLERHDPGGMGRRWLRADPSRPGEWRVHPVTAALLRRPMLLIGGWHDPHLRGILDLWRRSREAGGRPVLRIGAWSHLDWGGGIDTLQLDFFRRHLLQRRPDGVGSPEPEGAAAPGAISLQCLSSGRWQRHGPHLPPPAGDPPGWGLRSDGLAAISPEEGELLPLPPPEGSPAAAAPARERSRGHVVLVHDPWRPAPGRGGHLGSPPGIVVRGDLDRRSDVACFTGPPLTRPLLLLGEPRLTLRVAADQPGFDLCGALSLIHPDGSSVKQLTTGVVRFRGEECRAPCRRELRLQPLCATLQPGERLRLSLAAAAWPQIAVNPGDGSLPLGGAGPAHRVITLTFELEDARLRITPLAGAN